MENEPRPLLFWVLLRHPGTPRARAKRWIQAGRVSVAGVVIRKPQENLADPGPALRLLDRPVTPLECGPGWQIHPGVQLLFMDSALAVVNKGPGLLSVPAAQSDSSALGVLADFLAGRLKAGHPGWSLPPAIASIAILAACSAWLSKSGRAPN